jgi:hypothetical protein
VIHSLRLGIALYNMKFLHGRDTMEYTMFFKRLRTRREKLIIDLDFLKQCVDSGLTPNFAKCKHLLNK